MCSSMTRSASMPLPACPTTSTPSSCPSRKHSSSRASCSSSTTIVRSGSVPSMSSHAVIFAGTISSGMTMRAQVPSPGTLSSCSW